MSLVETPLMKSLARYLDVTAYRQGVVAANIANIDTPGYRTNDINFKQELDKALQAPDAPVTPSPQQVPGLLERPDGNNVNLDREGLLLAQTQLHFATGVALLRSELKRISMAIQEDKA
ncbi:MAG: flagellar basal body protein [Candidatus Korobacteraceae bacterium]|jgi:flagellar basal-body rod protein FlgB